MSLPTTNAASDTNKRIVNGLLEGWNTGNMEVFDEHCAPEFVNHSVPPGLPPTAQGWKLAFGQFLWAFPDLHIDLNDVISEGDRVAARFTLSGTHKGEWMGVAAMQQRVRFSAMVFFRIEDGKIVERWDETNMMALLQQIQV